MGLEVATYISDLVSTNPLSSDLEAQGDDHLRLVKAVVKATFPNASRAIYFDSTIASASTGPTLVAADDKKLIPLDSSAGALTVTLPAVADLWDGWSVEILKADHSANVITVDGNGSETINGILTFTLYQRYQKMKVIYSSSLGAFYATRDEIPPIGAITGFVGTSAPSGWLFPNGQSIGNASSSATQRANADTLGLFTVLWNSCSNSVCSVSGGRGVSAASDFAANKRISLPNICGRSLRALDNLGGVSAQGVLGNIAGGTTNGEAAGTERVTLSVANLAEHSHSNTASTLASGSATVGQSLNVSTSAFAVSLGAGHNLVTAVSLNTGTLATTMTNANNGSTSAHSNLGPSFVTGMLIKL